MAAFGSATLLACVGGTRLLLFLSCCLLAASFANQDDRKGGSAAVARLAEVDDSEAEAETDGADGADGAAVLRLRGVNPSGVALLPSGAALRSGVAFRCGVAVDCDCCSGWPLSYG